jgi:signal transduction histidine kinase
VSDEYVDVNRSLELAITKANDILNLDGHIEVAESFGTSLPKVRTSYEMLAEAFRILIKNGMEAILEKHPEAKSGAPVAAHIGVLRVSSRTLGKDMLEVEIQDDGVGIHPENMSEMFQLRWSTKETGMGFGLFWLKDYVQGLNGRVEVESHFGEGTTFRIFLPGCSKED